MNNVCTVQHSSSRDTRRGSEVKARFRSRCHASICQLNALLKNNRLIVRSRTDPALASAHAASSPEFSGRVFTSSTNLQGIPI